MEKVKGAGPGEDRKEAGQAVATAKLKHTQLRPASQALNPVFNSGNTADNHGDEATLLRTVRRYRRCQDR
jgi:hypothetical protein